MDHEISSEEKGTSSLGGEGEDKKTVTIIREEVYLAMRVTSGESAATACSQVMTAGRRNRSWV